MKRFVVGWSYDEVGPDKDRPRVGVFTVIAENALDAKAGALTALPMLFPNRPSHPIPRAWVVKELADAGEFVVFRDGDELRVTQTGASRHVKTVR